MIEFNWIDLVFFGLICTSMVVGLLRGIIKETITLIIWFMAAYLAIHYGLELGNLFIGIGTEDIRQIFSSIFIFICTLIVGGMSNYLISKVIKNISFTIVDKTLGASFGILRAGVIILLLIPILTYSFSNEHWWDKSQLIPKFQTFSIIYLENIPEALVTILSKWHNNLTQ